MSKKTAKFELIGSLVGHPEYPQAKRGDVLTLEVGDDGKPTSELLVSRTRPLGRELVTGEEMTEKEAKGKAKEIIEGAKAQAQKILDDANAQASELLEAAKGDNK